MSQITTVSTYQGTLRTVTQQSILYFVARMMGLDTSQNLLSNTSQAYLTYINKRAREAWERYDWSELMIDDQRAFEPSWNPISTYTTGQIVFSWTDLNYYQALQNVPANTNPANGANPAYWSTNPNLPLPLVVPTFQQNTSAGPTTYFPEIGTVFGVYSNDPYKNRTPVEVPWTRSALGVTVWPQYTTWATSPVVLPGGVVSYPYVNLNTVFILHRSPYPGFAEDSWISGTSYAPGNIVYYNTDTYVNIQATNSQLPTNTSYWTLVPFPYVLSEFVKEAAYADALREDGQQEKAAMVLGNVNTGTGAYKYLWDEYDKQTTEQSLTQRYSVIVGSTW